VPVDLLLDGAAERIQAVLHLVDLLEGAEELLFLLGEVGSDRLAQVEGDGVQIGEVFVEVGLDLPLLGAEEVFEIVLHRAFMQSHRLTPARNARSLSRGPKVIGLE